MRNPSHTPSRPEEKFRPEAGVCAILAPAGLALGYLNRRCPISSLVEARTPWGPRLHGNSVPVLGRFPAVRVARILGCMSRRVCHAFMPNMSRVSARESSRPGRPCANIGEISTRPQMRTE